MPELLNPPQRIKGIRYAVVNNVSYRDLHLEVGIVRIAIEVAVTARADIDAVCPARPPAPPRSPSPAAHDHLLTGVGVGVAHTRLLVGH